MANMVLPCMYPASLNWYSSNSIDLGTRQGILFLCNKVGKKYHCITQCNPVLRAISHCQAHEKNQS